ncbi:MAG: lysylphosphatidylglycerol synthase transmembrane domain-containing protein [bacterium]
MHTLERKILSGVVIAVLVYASVALWADARAVLQSLTSLPYQVFMAALGLTVVNYALRFAKWSLFLRRLEIRVPVRLSFVVFLAGMSMSITPGKVGEVLKSVLLRQSCDVPVARTAPVVFMERLTDLLGLVMIAMFGFSRFEFGRVPFVIVCVLLLLTIVALQRPRLIHKGLGLLDKVPRLSRFRAKAEELYASTRAMLEWKILAATTVVSVFSWGMEATAFHLLVEGLGGHADFGLTSFIYAMSTILGAVSFLPGGLGVTEGSMIGVLNVFGVFESISAATAATYLIRFATLWFGVVAGFIALLVFRTMRGSHSSLDL